MADTPRPAPVLPRYTTPRSAGEIAAHFPGGIAVPVVRGRVRAYPGLPGPAPVTAPVYRALGAEIRAGARVLDAGCGAGIGSAALAAEGLRVLAVDADPRAVAFARELGAEVELRVLEVGGGAELEPVDAAFVVDVLGLARDPVGLLDSVRRALSSGGPLLVAEARAHAAQRLAPPARRAFSPAGLDALLVRTGFEVRQRDDAALGLLTRSALPSADPSHLALAAACVAAPSSPAVALAELERALGSPSAAVRLEAMLLSSDLHERLGDGDAAAARSLDAAALAPGDGRALSRLARLALANGEQGDALSLSLRASELSPTEPEVAVALALVASAMDHPDAVPAWRIAQRLSPDDLAVATELARNAADRGDPSLGIHTFERLRAYGDPLPADFYVVTALLLRAAGRGADARLELDFARRMDPGNPVVNDLCAELDAAAS